MILSSLSRSDSSKLSSEQEASVANLSGIDVVKKLSSALIWGDWRLQCFLAISRPKGFPTSIGAINGVVSIPLAFLLDLMLITHSDNVYNQ
jgi:hypothetical protein